MTNKPRRRSRPTNYRIITHGVELLKSDTSAGELPGRLVDEFGLTPDLARELAGKAVEIHRKPRRRSRLDTRPLDGME